jgi:hypothetical protein
MLTDVQELLLNLRGHNNIHSFAITIDPRVNSAYLSPFYMDDRLLDAIDDAKDESPLQEDQDVVFTAIFDALRSVTRAWIYPGFEAEQAGVVRKENGSVLRVVRKALTPSRSEFDFEYSPFFTVFPRNHRGF